jgi:hypothetical protein
MNKRAPTASVDAEDAVEVVVTEVVEATEVIEAAAEATVVAEVTEEEEAVTENLNMTSHVNISKAKNQCLISCTPKKNFRRF